MRLEYSQIPLPSGRLETRPCAKISFNADTDRLAYLALIDSGSLHTVAPLSAFEGIDLGEPETKIPELAFAKWRLWDVPIHRMSMQIVAPEPWNDISLPDVPVVVADADMPFVVLGSTALRHVVVLLRDEDQLLHVKTLTIFKETNHCHDKAF